MGCRMQPSLQRLSESDYLGSGRRSAEDIQDLPIVSYLDVIVDGKFDLERRDVSLPWKGSPNQRVIDVPKSREVGLVVLHA